MFPRIPVLGALLALRILNLSIGSLLKCALSTKVQFFHARRFYSAAWRSLRQGSANMDVLVALGTSASYFFSVGTLVLELVDWRYHGRDFFETSAMLLMFILLGKYLEVSHSPPALGPDLCRGTWASSLVLELCAFQAPGFLQ